jgi:hypothetical protein
MKKIIRISLWASFLSVAVLVGCKKEDVAPKKTVPVVSTTAISAIGNTEATGGGNVIDDGNDDVTARGIVWGTSTAPTTSLSTKTSNGNGTGAFTSSLTSLTPGTQYFVRAYATNGEGTSYGNEVTFTTGEEAPAVTTTAASSLTASSVTLGGNVTSVGTSSVSARGVVYSTSQNPTIDLTTKTSNGTGAGAFTANLTGLSEGTLYYVRAYATSTVGTSYGDQVSFTTKTIQDLALALDGVNDHVVVPHSSALNLGNNFTIEAWVYLEADGPAFQAIVHKWSTNQYTLEINNNKLNFVLKTGANFNVLASPEDFPRGHWVHIAGVRDGSAMRIYEGGLLKNSMAVSGSTSTASGGNMVIGRRSDYVADHVKGKVDEVRFWNVTRSQSQLDANKNASISAGSSGLVAYYPMKTEAQANSTNSGLTTVVDATSNNNNGTLTSSSLSGSTSNWTANLSYPATFSIGQDFAGGIIVYIDGSGRHGVVAAKTNIPIDRWGCPGTVTRATSSSIGGGKSNTQYIIADCNSVFTAAYACSDLISNGLSDWHLPSRDEFSQLVANPTGLGLALNSDNYGFWTSTQSDGTYAYSYYLGRFIGTHKSTDFYVRPVRYF